MPEVIIIVVAIFVAVIVNKFVSFEDRNIYSKLDELEKKVEELKNARN